jgi:hypothetical protein
MNMAALVGILPEFVALNSRKLCRIRQGNLVNLRHIVIGLWLCHQSKLRRWSIGPFQRVYAFCAKRTHGDSLPVGVKIPLVSMFQHRERIDFRLINEKRTILISRSDLLRLVKLSEFSVLLQHIQGRSTREARPKCRNASDIQTHTPRHALPLPARAAPGCTLPKRRMATRGESFRPTSADLGRASRAPSHRPQVQPHTLTLPSAVPPEATRAPWSPRMRSPIVPCRRPAKSFANL